MVGIYKSNLGKQIKVKKQKRKYLFYIIKNNNIYGPFNTVNVNANDYILAGGLIITSINDKVIKLEDVGEFEDYFKIN